MRKRLKYVKPKLYDTRIITTFLLLPYSLHVGSENGPLERRWLERASIKQEVGKNLWGEPGWYDRHWVD